MAAMVVAKQSPNTVTVNTAPWLSPWAFLFGVQGDFDWGLTVESPKPETLNPKP